MQSRVEEPQRTNTSPLFVRVTGHGTGGIATLILDGAGTRQLLKNVFRCKRDVAAVESGALLFGKIVDDGGRLIDEAIAAPVGQRESLTGNEQFELSCHGGLGAIEAVEIVLQAAGFARGRETELLERAHLNGKLSLLTFEAQRALAHAATARQAHLLLDHATFQQRLERLGMDAGLGMRTGVAGWRERLRAGIEQELRCAEFTARVLGTHRVVLRGPVNAGKSSLANALAEAHRHLVSDIPGTTLDRVETPVELRGLSVLLTDTAGARATSDPLEQEGQRRAENAAREATLRLLVLDGSVPPSDADMDWLAEQARTAEPLLLVLTKSDRGTSEAARGLGFLCSADPLVVSAQDGSGMESLREAMERALLPEAGALGAFTERQRACLRLTLEHLNETEDNVRVLDPLRSLIGSRPNREELYRVLGVESQAREAHP